MSRRSFALLPHTPVLPSKVISTLLAVAVLAGAAHAAPRITNLSLRGLQTGGTTTLIVEGRELLPNPRVVLPVPIAKQTVKQGAAGNRVEVELTLADDVAPGIYPLRICSDRGISPAELIGVDALPQKPFASRIDALPVALHGRVAGNQILSANFVGAKGQRIVLDVEAQRLGSPLDPVVRLYDPHGAQIAWSPPEPAAAGDARCRAVLPADGRYTIELHDRLYRAKNPGYFRLKIGDLHYAGLAFPLGATAGRKTPLEFVSADLPAAAAVEFSAPRGAIGRLPAGIRSAGFTGPQPEVIVSDFPELVEAPASGSGPQALPAAPVAVSGRISAKGEEDVYQLAVEPGAKLRIDVLADRAGSALDGVLVVRRKNGQQLAQSDDRPGTSDPGLEVKVPQGEDALLLSLRDLRGEGGADFVYRIAVEDASSPDFSLSLADDTVNIPAGGSQVLEVRAERRGVTGPIELSFDGLPEGVEVTGNWIDAGETIALVTLTARRGAASCGLVSVTGQGSVGEQVVTRAALSAAAEPKRQPWLRRELAVAAARVAPVRVAWSEPAGEERMLLGGSLPLQVKMERAGRAPGKVRIRLATTQVVPQKSVKQNNKNVRVDDTDRALRLKQAVELPPEAASAEVWVLVPNDLDEKIFGVALVAELLSADGKNVIAQAATPVRRFKAVRAVTLALKGRSSIEAKAGEGETGTLKGTLSRAAGLDVPATVTLTGLPKGYPAPKVEVAADQSEFELPVRFPADAKPAELKGVKLVATVHADPSDAKAVSRSGESPVTIKVVK